MLLSLFERVYIFNSTKRGWVGDPRVGFLVSGKTNLGVLQGRKKSQGYTRALDNYLLFSAAVKQRQDWIFQQDGASIYTSSHTRNFFCSNKVNGLEWLAKSPVHSLIENL